MCPNLNEQLLFEPTRLQSIYNLGQALKIKVHGLPEPKMEISAPEVVWGHSFHKNLKKGEEKKIRKTKQPWQEGGPFWAVDPISELSSLKGPGFGLPLSITSC